MVQLVPRIRAKGWTAVDVRLPAHHTSFGDEKFERQFNQKLLRKELGVGGKGIRPDVYSVLHGTEPDTLRPVQGDPDKICREFHHLVSSSYRVPMSAQPVLF